MSQLRKKYNTPRPPKMGRPKLTVLESIGKFVFAINIVIFTLRSGHMIIVKNNKETKKL
jgi:hypothetical protein